MPLPHVQRSEPEEAEGDSTTVPQLRPASGTVELESGVGECRRPILESVTVKVGDEIRNLNDLGETTPTGHWSLEMTSPGGFPFPDDLVEAATGCVPRANGILPGLTTSYVYNDYSTVRRISIFHSVLVDCPFAEPTERAVTLSFGATLRFENGVWTYYPPSLLE